MAKSATSTPAAAAPAATPAAAEALAEAATETATDTTVADATTETGAAPADAPATFNKATKKDMMMVDPRQLVADEGFNVRHDYGNVDELAASIAANGVKEPLSGWYDSKTDRYVVTDGFRRNRALAVLLERGVDVARVPFMLEPKGYSEKDRLLDMFIKNDGKRLTPLEEGYLFVRLGNMGYERNEISGKVGRTEAHISNMIQLAQADPQIQQFIKDGKVSSTEVTKLIKDVKDADEQKAVLNDAVKDAEQSGKTKATAKNIAKSKEKTGAKSKAETKAAKAPKATPGSKGTLAATLLELASDIPLSMKTARVEALRKLVDFANGSLRLDQLLDYFMEE